MRSQISLGGLSMTIHRRELLKGGAALSAVSVLPNVTFAQSLLALAPGAWRTFQVVTRLEIAKPDGKVQAWVPLPAVNEADWFLSKGSEWKTNAASAQVKHDPKYGAEMLHVLWADDEKAPSVEVTSRVSTRNRAIDEWIVENAFRDAKVRGCGVGDIAAMLKTGNLGGKCADLNALYVGLARAAGLPARDVYGLRVAPSKFGYKSLGAGSEIVTKAQHCRAEVYLTGFGWIPVDPADV